MWRRVHLVISQPFIDKVRANSSWMANSRTVMSEVNAAFAKEIEEIGCGTLSPRDVVRVAHMTRSNPEPFDMVDAAYRYLILYSSSETRDLYSHYLSWMRKHNQLHILQLNHMDRINYQLVEQVFNEVLSYVRKTGKISW